MNKINSISFLLLILLKDSFGFPDQGKWSLRANKKDCQYFQVSKTLYKDSLISLRVVCDNKNSSKIRLGYVIRESPCFQEYLGPQLLIPQFIKWYYYCPSCLMGDFGYNKINYIKNEIIVDCNHVIDQYLIPMKNEFSSKDIGNQANCTPPEKTCGVTTQYHSSVEDNYLQQQNMMGNQKSFPQPLFKRETANNSSNLKNNASIHIPHDGIYLLIVYMSVLDKKQTFDATVDIDMRGEYGYLSAVDWPLLPFYGLMCILYVIYAIIWLAMSALQWRDLLRIQFWIGGVILLGMIEKAVFYAEYYSINETGQSVRGAVLFAEVLSCLKRTLARMLVVIVSLGFGIVKPRLGPTLHRVVILGGLYFTLGAIEAILRVYKPKSDPTNQTLMAGIPLAVLDSVICWWVFSSLIQTTRTLRLRRNLVKLNLYRQFTNVLIFSVLASVIFMVWVIHYHKLTICLIVWKELWCDEAYWHLLFSIILLVIMILWRPTNNNQRYAFTALLDTSDDEDMMDNVPILEVHDGMKMRQHGNSGGSSNADSKSKENLISQETEEDLKWIEENIPKSLVDTALPALVDSDEEIMTTKFERNKME